ncbi:MAG TPA: DNA-binding protein [Candidatus Xenobia bacterium]|jgi:hypothetical protein
MPTPQPEVEPLLLEPRAAAPIVGLTPKGLLRLTREGKAPGIKLDGRWFFTRAGLQDWVARLQSEATVQ